MASTEVIPPTPIPNATSTTDTNKPVASNEPPTDEKEGGSSIIVIAILIVVLVVLLYYAYSKFTENANSESYVKGQEQERDDPVADFNLRESIRELQNMQRQILKTLSENAES